MDEPDNSEDDNPHAPTKKLRKEIPGPKSKKKSTSSESPTGGGGGVVPKLKLSLKTSTAGPSSGNQSIKHPCSHGTLESSSSNGFIVFTFRN